MTIDSTLLQTTTTTTTPDPLPGLAREAHGAPAEHVRVRVATGADQARWNGFVDATPGAQLYHRWEWLDIFAQVYGARATPLIAEEPAAPSGRVLGVLPLVAVGLPGRRPALVSLPYFGHAGALVAREPAFHLLLAAARDAARVQGAAHVELRHAHAVPAAAAELPARADKVLMHLALPDSPAALEKQIGSKLRADVRRPQKEGFRAEVGGRELVGEFHAAYAAVMRELGSPCHAAALFDETLARFGDRAFIVRVTYQGRTAGAAFLVGHGDVLEVPCAGTLHAFNKLRPNMLLYWTCFTAAIERGYRTFSFGRSTVDAGTYAFKKNWGAAPVPLPYHYLLPPEAPTPGAHADDGLLARASRAWTRLPLPVTNTLGPVLARWLA